MDFKLWQVIVLAVVQGVTEFLPISSDGHLIVIAPLLFGGQSAQPKMLDLTIALHMGTLGSILVYYRHSISRLLGQDRRLVGLLFLGTIPAVVLVLVCKVLLDDWFDRVLENPLLAGFMLPVTGIAVLWAQAQSRGQRDYHELKWHDSLLIGTAQATAILPGLSRSGTTIASGVGVGMSRESAVIFSFLLAIPALIGAGAYESLKILKDAQPLSTSPGNLALGILISFAVGLLSLSWLNRILQRGKLHWLGWYCIVLGILVIAWQATLLFGKHSAVPA